jgi:hypothetical protein
MFLLCRLDTRFADGGPLGLEMIAQFDRNQHGRDVCVTGGAAQTAT